MSLNNVFGFLDKYILEPIRLDSGYNIINTALIAILFVIAAWLLWEKVFRKELARIDSRFIVAISFWLLFGATSRVLEDAGIVKSWLFITPFIYAWVGSLSVFVFFLALKIEKKYPRLNYWEIWGGIGFALAVFNLFLIEIKNPAIIAIVFVAVIASYFIISLSGKTFLKLYKDRMSTLALTGQLADGISSFIGITFFGFWEKHILGRSLIESLEARNILLINNSGAWIIIAVKIAVISIVLYLIDKYAENEKEKKFMKMLIFALGLMLGFRNTLEIAVLS